MNFSFSAYASSFKGNLAGLAAGDGRYLKNCRFEETKGWVKPAECERKGGGCKRKDGKVGKAGKGGKCPDWAPPRGELQSTAIKAKENVEGFYVHPELVKPILDSNLKKVARQKWKKAERLTDLQFEKLIDRFEKHPAKPQNYLPKKNLYSRICKAQI